MPFATPSDPIDTTADQRASDVLLRQFVGYRMKRAYLLIQDDMAETLAPFGLRTGTFSALAVVIASPGISQNDLSEVLDIKRSGVVVVVDELESAGVLKRKPVKGDRRTNALTVTAAGRRLWQKVEAEVRAHEAALFAGLTPEEITQLRELLGRVRKGPKTDAEHRQ
ncbi:MarR family winged helix-turn-helix transcriptional regulator [Pararhodobacter oceanensis]|uniref:MarR family transcriptional regulator n=1 Tax=Pararhodobacter oceanensis TaxID=2172121 RepID=A0A2T8HPU0_9RHOB|nr:MarR family winged helix-turn-helix transcriptional regulator [Pararhodobacter oceanensis]PVH27440.1 MarR family transcriptional regulator [Pararhodobacter oceanensis]